MCVCTCRGDDLSEKNVEHTQKKRWVIYDPIYSASDPRFSLTMDWWWMAIGPSLTISARELETKFSTPVIHTQKKTKYFFPSFLKVDINRLVKVSLFRLWSNQMADLDDEGYLFLSLFLLLFYFIILYFILFLYFHGLAWKILARGRIVFEKRDNDTEREKKQGGGEDNGDQS